MWILDGWLECVGDVAGPGLSWPAVGAYSCTAVCFLFPVLLANVIPNPCDLLVGFWEQITLENCAIWSVPIGWGSRNACIFYNASSFTHLSNWFCLGQARSSFFLSLIFLSSHCFACATGNGVPSCIASPWAPPLGLPWASLSLRAISMETKALCFKKNVFRSCCLASGRTYFLNGRTSCSRVPLFSLFLPCMPPSFHLIAVSYPWPPFLVSSISLSLSLFWLHKNLLSPPGACRERGRGPSSAPQAYCMLRPKSTGCSVTWLSAARWVTARTTSWGLRTCQCQAVAISARGLTPVVIHGPCFWAVTCPSALQ